MCSESEPGPRPKSVAGSPRQNDQGRELVVVIDPDELTLTVAEYRPVYVNGDVTKPGAVQFRWQMTARQAIALAGGFDVARFRITNPFIQTADLESDVRSLLTEEARNKARAARLEAEFNNSPTMPEAAVASKTAAKNPNNSDLWPLEADPDSQQLSRGDR
jgi:polysaccharide export outer membrane protein